MPSHLGKSSSMPATNKKPPKDHVSIPQVYRKYVLIRWSGLPFPSPGDPPDPGMEPRSPAWQAGLLLLGPPQPFPESPKKSWSLRLHGLPVNLPSFKNPPALSGAGSLLGWADTLILHECSRPLSCHYEMLVTIHWRLFWAGNAAAWSPDPQRSRCFPTKTF